MRKKIVTILCLAMAMCMAMSTFVLADESTENAETSYSEESESTESAQEEDEEAPAQNEVKAEESEVTSDSAVETIGASDESVPPIDAVAVNENGLYANAGALYQAWFANGNGESYPYPDYITGVWSSDGTIDNLVFGVLKGYDMEKAKAEILAQIENKDSASFVEGGEKSAKMLYEFMMQNIIPYLNEHDDTGVVSVGVDEKNCVIVIDAVPGNAGLDAVKKIVEDGGHTPYVQFNEVSDVAATEDASSAATENAESVPADSDAAATEEKNEGGFVKANKDWSHLLVFIGGTAVIAVLVVLLWFLKHNIKKQTAKKEDKETAPEKKTEE